MFGSRRFLAYTREQLQSPLPAANALAQHLTRQVTGQYVLMSWRNTRRARSWPISANTDPIKNALSIAAAFRRAGRLARRSTAPRN
jgi:hypothetical protein